MPLPATIENQDRVKTYEPVNATGPFYLGFPLFDDTGADLEVTLDGLPAPGWKFYGSLVPGFTGAPNTWVDGYIVFTSPVSGTLVVEGNRHPRRIDNFQEGRGVPARDLNAVLNILTAISRELWQKLQRALVVPPNSPFDVKELMAAVSRLGESADQIDILSQIAPELHEIYRTVIPNMDAILAADNNALAAHDAAVQAEVFANLARAYADLVGGKIFDFGLLSDDAVGEDDWGHI